MSIRIYNDTTKDWEKHSTMLASSIKVTDPSSKFESNTVEGCLDEVADKVKVLQNDVKYIYENGTIGGGGGGGGGSQPEVTIDGATEYVVNSDDILDIYYYFNSPNPGSGTNQLTFGDKIIRETVPQGRNRWTVGPFERGTHHLTIAVEDQQGFWSMPVKVTVVSGSIEIESNFDDSKDFTLNDEIVIPFVVFSELPETVMVDLTFNGKKETKPANIGANEWKIGKLPFMGVSEASIKCHTSKYESNQLNYTLVAANSEDLFVSSTFNSITFEEGKRLMIDYRISMKGQYEFLTDLYMDGNLFASVKSKPGVNFWDVGTDLPLGPHTFKIVAKTVDLLNTAEVEISTEIVSAGYEPYRPVNIGLIAEFNANGKLNNSLNREVWIPENETDITCNLHNFNYVTNGWLDNALYFNGKTYAEIEYKPFEQGVKTGFSIEILYKINNVGDMDGKVMNCRNMATPFQGVSIDTQTALLASKNSEIVSSKFQEGVWTRQTWTIDRSTNLMKLYTNAVLSNIAYIEPNNPSSENYEDEFSYNGKITLGAARDLDGKIVNNSSSYIKIIRIYNRALSSNEVLQNHIADIKDRDEQLAIRDLNFGEEAIPTMKMVGNLENFGEGEERVVQIDYSDPRDPSKRIVKDGCLVSWQGTSSRDYPVKNYTIKLREGGLPFVTYAPKDGWLGEDRWTLKANYMDSSHANNVGTNKFIHDFFKPYPYPSQVIDPETRANVDGFPMKLLINGDEVGLYTWNIDRYAPHNYGFIDYDDKGLTVRHPNAVSYEIGVNSTNGAGSFWDSSWESIRAEFKHRYNFRGEEEDVTEVLPPNQKVLTLGKHNELVDLVTWISGCTDAEFYAELKEHMSIRHTIDYFLIAYCLGMVDNLGKNMILSTWGKNEDGNTIWYPSFYDCDSILGLANNGKITFGPGVDMDTGDFNTSNSALWTKLQKMFSQEIRDRYRELRMPRTVDGKKLPPIFSAENLMQYYGGQVTETIGQSFYNKDAELKYLIPESKQWVFMCSGDRRQYTERWIRERFVYIDSVYEFETFTNNKIVIRSNVTGAVKLRLKTYSPQHVLISFSDSAADKVKQYVDKDRWYDFEADLSNGRDNNISISGALNVMYVDGIKDLNASFINVGQAKKLVEVDCSNSSYIQQIALGDNAYLQSVKCPNCKNLGLKLEDKVLDLEKCVNLRYLDCSKTKLGAVKLNTKGGVIDHLNCSDTLITTFSIAGQEYLTELELSNCPELSELTVDNCNSLNRIAMPNTRLSKFHVTGCDKLTYVDISQTKFLDRLDLRGCPNLATLKMQGVSNPNLSELDLSTSINLTHLDVSSNSFLRHIVFGKYVNTSGQTVNYNKLKHFDANNSTLETIRFNKSSPIPDGLDLAGFTFDMLNLKSCVNLVKIKNINLYATTSGSPFYNCQRLESITGTVNLTDSMNAAFYGCKSLTTLPNLILDRVTSATESFEGCSKLTMNNMKYIMSKLGPKFTSAYQMFLGCNEIAGTIPENLFEKTPNITGLSYFFYGMDKITGEIPPGLFRNIPKVVNIEQMFAGTSIEGALPENLLELNTNITNMNGTFARTKLSLVPPQNFFREQRKLTTLYGCFASCKEMNGELNDRWFISLRELNSIGSMFNDCPNLRGEIPANLFNNIAKSPSPSNKLIYVGHFISGTGIVGRVPENLFDSCHKIEEIHSFFLNTGIVGQIPDTLLANNPRIKKANHLFGNCTGITGHIPPNLLKDKPILLDISSMFEGCNELTGDIPKGFLDDCTKITDIARLFSGCRSLSGEIPKRVSEIQLVPNPDNPDIMDEIEVVIEYGIFDKCANLVNASAVFNNCRGLRSEIPETLLINATKVVDLSNMFANCYYLYGPIPSKLFEKCYNLQKVDNFFADCTGIAEYLIDEDNPHCIPDSLFSKCYNLISARYFLGMVGDGRPYGTKLKGDIPPNLFANNNKLKDVYAFFWGCSGVTGILPSEFFKNNPNLENACATFSITKVVEVGPKLLLDNRKVKDLSSMFAGCNSITSAVPPLWQTTATKFERCFNGCVNATNYAEIPNTWK